MDYLICQIFANNYFSICIWWANNYLDIITGITPDITEYLDFGFYDWVVFKQNVGVNKPELGRWRGVSHQIGQLMTYWILPASGILISCGTVQRLTVLEEQTAEWKARISAFEEVSEQKFNGSSAEIFGPKLKKISDVDR